jgi:hypothetical protein
LSAILPEWPISRQVGWEPVKWPVVCSIGLFASTVSGHLLCSSIALVLGPAAWAFLPSGQLVQARDEKQAGWGSAHKPHDISGPSRLITLVADTLSNCPSRPLPDTGIFKPPDPLAVPRGTFQLAVQDAGKGAGFPPRP